MGGVDDELPRVVDEDVQGLEDDRDAFGLDDPGTRLQGGNHRLGLLVARIARCLFARDDAELLDPQLPGHRYGRPDLLLEFRQPRRVGVGDPVAESMDGRRRELRPS